MSNLPPEEMTAHSGVVAGPGMSADAQWEMLERTIIHGQAEVEALAALRERQQRQDEEIRGWKDVIRTALHHKDWAYLEAALRDSGGQG